MVAYQFLSKAYTDILGRAPDAAGWNYWEFELTRDNSADQLRRVGSTFFKSDEFLNKKYKPQEALTVLYRFTLNREPDAGGLHYWTDRIAANDNTYRYTTYERDGFLKSVDNFFGCQEFYNNVPKFLQPKYDFNGGTPIAINPDFKPKTAGFIEYYQVTYETESTLVEFSSRIKDPFPVFDSFETPDKFLEALDKYSAAYHADINAQIEEYKKTAPEGTIFRNEIDDGGGLSANRFRVFRYLKNPEIYVTNPFIPWYQEDDLRLLIGSAEEGTTIKFASSVIELQYPLYIPKNVHVTSFIDSPGIDYSKGIDSSITPEEYQSMARFVRSPKSIKGPMIILESGSSLSRVWVDGQRNSVDNPKFKPENINVITTGGNGTVVSFNRLDNSLGFSTLTTAGEINEVPRAKNTVLEGNFIDATYSNHAYKWTDGISNGGEDVVIKNNTIVNATDVGIVSFALNLSPNNSQNSKIIGNKIINLVNSAYGALASDGVYKEIDLPGGGRERLPGSKPFETKANAIELTFDHNTLWNSKGTHYDIAISIGTRAWFGEGSLSINGGTFTNNSSEGQQVRAGAGIVVSGAHNVIASGNQLNIILTPEALPRISKSEFVASLSSGYASFLFSDRKFEDEYVSGVIEAHTWSV